MINSIFEWCVNALIVLALFFGTTYEAVNVWIFCVIGPAIFVTLFCFAVYQHTIIKKLKKTIYESASSKQNREYEPHRCPDILSCHKKSKLKNPVEHG